MLACPPCRGLCPGGTAGASLSPDYSCSGRRCGGTLGVRGADLLRWQKRGSLGRSGSPCRARPASAQPVSAYGLGVSSHCPGTHAPSHRPAPRPTCTGIPPGRGARRPECSPHSGGSLPPRVLPRLDSLSSEVSGHRLHGAGLGWALGPGHEAASPGLPMEMPQAGRLHGRVLRSCSAGAGSPRSTWFLPRPYGKTCSGFLCFWRWWATLGLGVSASSLRGLCLPASRFHLMEIRTPVPSS